LFFAPLLSDAQECRSPRGPYPFVQNSPSFDRAGVIALPSGVARIVTRWVAYRGESRLLHGQMETGPMAMGTKSRRNHRRGTCSWRELLRSLERAHFTTLRNHGSHVILVYVPTGHTVALLRGGRDVPNGTLAGLLRAVNTITGRDLQW